MTKAAVPESHAEAVLRIKYLSRIYSLHARFYRRLETILTAASLIAGTAALLPMWQAVPGGVALSGIIVAAASIASAIGGFTQRANAFNGYLKSANDLLARSQDLNAEEIIAERTRLAGDEEFFELLRTVAWNDVLESNGYGKEKRPENVGQRIARALA